jgi:hypothetical protein
MIRQEGLDGFIEKILAEFQTGNELFFHVLPFYRVIIIARSSVTMMIFRDLFLGDCKRLSRQL